MWWNKQSLSEIQRLINLGETKKAVNLLDIQGNRVKRILAEIGVLVRSFEETNVRIGTAIERLREKDRMGANTELDHLEEKSHDEIKKRLYATLGEITKLIKDLE